MFVFSTEYMTQKNACGYLQMWCEVQIAPLSWLERMYIVLLIQMYGMENIDNHEKLQMSKIWLCWFMCFKI